MKASNPCVESQSNSFSNTSNVWRDGSSGVQDKSLRNGRIVAIAGLSFSALQQRHTDYANITAKLRLFYPCCNNRLSQISRGATRVCSHEATELTLASSLKPARAHVSKNRTCNLSRLFMSAPSLNSFRRIVVKVGSSLLVDAREAAGQTRMAGPSRRRHCRAPSRAERMCSSSPRARWRWGVAFWACPVARCPSRTARPPPPSARSRSPASGRKVSPIVGLVAGQVLVTLGDTEERRRYLYARECLNRLLSLGAVPIINENDTVATAEIRYGDNDRLAARVATMASADLLVLLSDVDGLYTAPPAPRRMRFICRSFRASPPRSRRWPAAPPRNIRAAGCAPRSRRPRSPRSAAPIW